MNPYSPNKIFHHQDRLQQMRNGQLPSPIQLHLVITNTCNLSCSFCAYRMDGYFTSHSFEPRQKMSLRTAMAVLDDCGSMGVKAVQFTGGGEPALHQDFKALVEHALRLRLEVAVVTNGVCLPDDWEDVLPGLTWSRLSVDAATRETYCRLKHCRGEIFDRLLVRVPSLMRAKGSCHLGASFLICEENWHEVLKFTRWADGAGFDNVRLGAAFSNERTRHFDSFYEATKVLCQQAETRERDGFKVWNLFERGFQDLERGSPGDAFCGYQQLCTYIGADGNVYRCCATAYNPRGLLGNVNETSFMELWNSPDVKDKIGNFDARQCPPCPFDDKNRQIAYALDNNPMHVAFI